MALPPGENESFIREVEEDLRRDQMRDAAKRYGWLIGLGTVLFLAAVGGFLYWRNQQTAQALADTETLVATLSEVGEGKMAGAPAKLDEIAKSDADGPSAAARLSRAALALQTGDRKTASAIYAAMAADADLAKPYQDLALIRGTAVDYDSIGPDAVIARLQPLAKPGEPFFGSAGEMTAMALLAKGQRAAAGQLFARIAADKETPPSLRARAVQVAGSLGVDASASLPASQAPAQ